MPPSMADWSLLPTELVQLISQKLNSDFYLLRFRSVCSKWRSSIPNYRPNHHLPLKFPLPSVHTNTNTNDNECYLVKHNIFLIKPTTIPIPHLNQQILQPLLIRIGPDVNGKTHLWHPLNLDKHSPLNFPDEVVVFDFNHISIVDLGHVFVLQSSPQNDPYSHAYFDKVVAATYPGEQKPHFVTYDFLRQQVMLRPGDDGWMEIPNLSSCCLGDICNFKGRICVAKDKGKTVMVGPDLSLDLVAAKLTLPGRIRLCLVESELLLVDTLATDTGGWMEVYRLDEKKKEWVKLSNLGDRVLFLGRKCSFSASASDMGFAIANGNCVINLEVRDIGCGICDLNLDENRILPLSDYPEYFNLLEASGLDDDELHLEIQSDEDEDGDEASEDEDEDEESEEEEGEDDVEDEDGEK